MKDNLTRYIPGLNWALNYDKKDLSGDLSAGITVAVMLIPQAMAYSMLAGLPPVIGLYASVIPLLIYSLFGTSRQLAVGPVAMISLLVASGVGAMNLDSGKMYIAYAVMLSMMVGGMQFFMGVARLGFLTNFLSHPVISGFTSAAALIIGLSQLKHILGVEITRTHLIHNILWQAGEKLSQWQLPTVGIGLGAIAILILLKKKFPKAPGALIVVAVSSLVVYFLGLDESGVKIVGDVPAGLPSPSLPMFNSKAFMDLLPIALTISFIGFIESYAVAKKIATEKKYEISPDKELIGLGLANFVGSFFSASPVTGGFSRTAVNDRAGAKTGLASLLTAILVGVSLIFFTPLFYYLPKAVLAAIVMVAVVGLIDIQEVKHLWHVKRDDLAFLILTFVSTLTFGVKQGILIGIAASIIYFVAKKTRPHLAILGSVPGTTSFRNIERFQEAQQIPGLLMVRMDSQFYYGNVNFLKDSLDRLEKESSPKVRTVLIDASAINDLDSSADTAFHEILEDYRNRGIKLLFANVKGPVLDVMERSGFANKLGNKNFYLNMAEAYEAIKK